MTGSDRDRVAIVAESFCGELANCGAKRSWEGGFGGKPGPRAIIPAASADDRRAENYDFYEGFCVFSFVEAKMAQARRKMAQDGFKMA